MKTPLYFDHPDDMTGQELAILVETAITEYAGDCQECVKHAFDDEEAALWQAKQDAIESIGISDEAPEHKGCYKHVWLVDGDKSEWLGSVPIDGNGVHLDALYGLDEMLNATLLSDDRKAEVSALIALTCAGKVSYHGLLTFLVQVMETPENPK